MKRSLLSSVILSLFLFACSSEPMITDSDVLVHENRGELVTLYNQINTDLQAAKPGSDVAENRQAYLEKVGRKIAENKETLIYNSLERDYSSQSISTLLAAQARAEEIKTYNDEVYGNISSELSAAISGRRAEVNQKETEFSALGDDKAPQKVKLLDEIIAIQGGEQAKEYEAQKSAYIDGLFEKATSALASKRNEDVQMLLDNLEIINPEYPGTQELRHKLIAAEYEQKFWDALGSGDTGKAYETFKQLTKIPDYVQNNPDVAPIADDIAKYFIAEGTKQRGKSAISAAYQAFSRARYIRNAMGKKDQYAPAEEEFIEFIVTRLESFVEKEQTVPAYGYLSILEELNPEHPVFLKYAQKVNNAMLEDATIKLIPSAFTEAESKRSFGRGIVSRINQDLMEKIPSHVKVIEGSLAASNYSSGQIKEMANPDSYYFLSGEILEASVETNETPASLTKRVLTSYKRVENPDYIAWTQLKKRERKETPEPENTIEVPVEEDVTLKKTIVEKQGVFSITYRLAEAVSAGVAFSDAMNKRNSFSGENIEGIELGLFKQEAKYADLPTDADMLEELSLEVAVEAADKIAGKIMELEDAYLAKADAAVISEDFNVAASNYGYRNVLLQAQGKTDEDMLSKVRSYAIRWKAK